MTSEANDSSPAAAPGAGSEWGWSWAGRAAVGFSAIALIGGLVVLGRWTVPLWVSNFVGFVSLSVTCLAVYITIRIFLNQARYAALDKEATTAILAKIRESSSTAAQHAGSAEDNTVQIIQLLKETALEKTHRPLSKDEVDGALTVYANAPKAAKQILWVDDNPDWIRLERKTFEAAGVLTVWVSNTDRALSALKGNSFSAVITDMGRVEGDREGYVLLDAMRTRGDNTPVVVYSSSRDPRHVAEVLAHDGQGATNDPTELFELVMNELV